MPVTPVHQSDQGHGELATGRGELVVVAHRVLLVRHPLEHIRVDQSIETIREDVASHAEAVLELVEPVQPKQNVSDDEQGPPVAKHPERAGDRAHLIVVGSSEHVSHQSPSKFSNATLGQPARTSSATLAGRCVLSGKLCMSTTGVPGPGVMAAFSRYCPRDTTSACSVTSTVHLHK